MPGSISNEVARMMQGPQGSLQQPQSGIRPGIGAAGGKAGLGPLLALLAGGLGAGGLEHGKYGGGEVYTDRIIKALEEALGGKSARQLGGPAAGEVSKTLQMLKQLSKLDPGHPKAGGMPYGPSPEHSPTMHLMRSLLGQNPKQGSEDDNGKR